MVPTTVGAADTGTPAVEDVPIVTTAKGLAMMLWTFGLHTSMCCMLTWVRACQNGAAFAHAVIGAPILLPARRPAEVLPFPARRVARGGAFGGPATVIPLGRR